MLLLAKSLPITLEVLDNHQTPLETLAASLHHLDGESALVVVCPEDLSGCLHWGTPVRFTAGDCPNVYEFTGAVVAHEPSLSLLTGEQTEAQSSVAASSGACEFLIRLWECRAVVQRRRLPRRRSRFVMEFRSLPSEAPNDNWQNDNWQNGWGMNIGAGGMCLRVPASTPLSSRLALRFVLPVYANSTPAEGRSHRFELYGRVLRTTSCGRHNEMIEIAVKFERLSVEDGMILSGFLCGPT